MASILSHQVESRVNDLYIKLQTHAQIIMRLSFELDKTKTENEELKKVVSNNRKILKKLCNAHNNTINNNNNNNVNASLITTELNETYDNYVELGQVQLDNNTNNEVINDNITDTEDIQVSENISKS